MFAESSRSKSVAPSVIKTAQLFKCKAAYIMYVMLAYERLCTKTVPLISCTIAGVPSPHRK
jgi:hypothetical protein